MTMRCDTAAPADGSILSLLNGIIAITEEMIGTLEEGSYEEMERLTALRQECIDRLQTGHTPAAGAPPADAAEIRRVIEQLNGITARLTDRMEDQSSSLMSAIHAMQHKRYYGNEQRGRE
ncbi:MAG: flagellar protein FliT [Bacteroidetes bacterium]|nr:flagellar protein FliT [Bacteroidota bacterium]